MGEASKRSAFGEQLRQAREERRLAIEAVSGATRIAVRHLNALERSDLGALPPGPFGKGYVRAYAQFLGIDPEPILEAYRARERQRGVGASRDDERLLSELSHLVNERTGARSRPAVIGGWRRGLAIVLVLFGFMAASWWFLGRARAPETAVATADEASAPVSAGATADGTLTDDRGAAAPATDVPTDALLIPDYGVGTGVVDRRLVGRADRFAAGTTVFFWTRVLGGQRGHVIRHVWFQEGRAVMRVDLPIGGPHWRTQSSLPLPRGSAGRWVVEARTSDGRLLARDEFLCEAARRPEAPR
jgi:transcriptional regulator with XRE-family HTH domain